MYLAYRILSTTATLTAALTGCDQQNNSVSLGFSQDGPFSGPLRRPPLRFGRHIRFKPAAFQPGRRHPRQIPTIPYGAFGPCSSTLHSAQGQAMNSEHPLRILLADDFAPWRVRIRSMLRARPEWEVVADACDGLHAVEKTTELRPDIVLLDVGMPKLDGIEAAKRIRQCSPSSKIIFLTQENDPDIRTAALSVGVEGYLLKAHAMRQLLPAVEALFPNGHKPRSLSCD